MRCQLHLQRLRLRDQSVSCPTDSAPTPDVTVGSPLLSEGLFGDLILEHRLGQKHSQPCVLSFLVFETLGRWTLKSRPTQDGMDVGEPVRNSV